MNRPEPTYGERARQPAHKSLFRRSLQARAGDQPVHEWLIDQANLRGFMGATSNRSDWGELDHTLSLQDVLIGLIQPHAPLEARVVKLIVRILQSGQLEPEALHFAARRERALANLQWIVELIPEPEVNDAIEAIQATIRARPPRNPAKPVYRYDPRRLLGRAHRAILSPDRLRG